jgi:LacI family transcriptional regulator
MINGRKEASVSVERQKGYIKALNINGIEVVDDYLVYADYLEEMAYEKTKELLTKFPELTALFCASDMMALGAMRAIRECNRRIPNDISIIGFDNIPLSAYSTPSLTTVSQDFYMMGYEASKQLLKMINNESVKKNVFLMHKLLERDSISML